LAQKHTHSEWDLGEKEKTEAQQQLLLAKELP